jgi:hypothetical protein
VKDCAGAQHPDDEPVTWRQFDREMAHRNEIQRVKDEALQKALELRAAQMLLSHRLIIAGLAILTIAFQVFVYLRR